MNDDALAQDSDDPLIECLTFCLGNETYGIEVLYVQEVLRSPEIAPVPGSPSHVLGIINLRGKVIAVNDIRTMLGLPSIGVTGEARILLMELDGYVQGMLVDEVAEIVKFKASDIEAETAGGDGNPVIRGTCLKEDTLYILLSAQELLMDDGTP